MVNVTPMGLIVEVAMFSIMIPARWAFAKTVKGILSTPYWVFGYKVVNDIHESSTLLRQYPNPEVSGPNTPI
jgi:hypothetical protein